MKARASSGKACLASASIACLHQSFVYVSDEPQVVATSHVTNDHAVFVEQRVWSAAQGEAPVGLEVFCLPLDYLIGTVDTPKGLRCPRVWVSALVNTPGRQAQL